MFQRYDSNQAPYEAEFFANSTWVVWNRPSSCTMAFIYGIGGGGGGGGGRGKTAGVNGGGGGGGAMGARNSLFLPLILLPSTMYIFVGKGGASGPGGSAANGTAGGAGERSLISLTPDASISESVIFASGNRTSGTAGGGGGGGTGSAGTAGTSAAAADNVSMPIGWALGLTNPITGTAGTAGGTNAGVGYTVNAGAPTWQGTGGAGCTTTEFTGGAITGAAGDDIFELGNPGGTTGAGNGNAAFRLPTLFGQCYGGTGGGTSNSVPGGNGGSGGLHAYGAGGGGGGAGVSTGGNGGSGAPGYIRIICW